MQTPSASAVRNTKDFVDFIATQKLEGGEILVSFDVVSLFTNVPTNLAVDVARRRLAADDTLEERTCLSVDNIITLLQYCLDATYLPHSQRSALPANLWHSNGITSVSDSCKPGDGGD